VTAEISKLCVDCGQPIERVRSATGITAVPMENGNWIVCLDCGALMIVDNRCNNLLRVPNGQDFNRARPELRHAICHWQGQAMAAIAIRGRCVGVV
jgi:hypothetical protein